MKVYNLQDDIFTKKYDVSTHLITSGDYYYHTHIYHELFYVIDGSRRHSLNGRVTTLEPGDFYLLAPGDVHCFLRESGNDASHRDIMVTNEQWKMACDFVGADLFMELKNRSPVHTKITANQVRSLEALLSDFISAPGEDKKRGEYANILCVELIRILLEENVHTKEQEYPAWLKNLLDKFNQASNFIEGLPKVLSYINYNQAYLCREFKKYIGMTMTEYLNNLRLNYAAMLLQTKQESIISIASAAGFQNLSYFNRCFKKKYGMTPSAFQKDVHAAEI